MTERKKEEPSVQSSTLKEGSIVNKSIVLSCCKLITFYFLRVTCFLLFSLGPLWDFSGFSDGTYIGKGLKHQLVAEPQPKEHDKTPHGNEHASKPYVSQKKNTGKRENEPDLCLPLFNSSRHKIPTSTSSILQAC